MKLTTAAWPGGPSASSRLLTRKKQLAAAPTRTPLVVLWQRHGANQKIKGAMVDMPMDIGKRHGQKILLGFSPSGVRMGIQIDNFIAACEEKTHMTRMDILIELDWLAQCGLVEIRDGVIYDTGASQCAALLLRRAEELAQYN